MTESQLRLIAVAASFVICFVGELSGQSLENVFENPSAESSISHDLDAVDYLTSHPLLIRKTTARQLAQIPGFSLPLARRLLRLVRNSPNITFTTIADSLYLSPEQLVLLESCTTLEETAQISRNKTTHNASWRTRTIFRFQETKGQNEGIYHGSQSDIYQRLLVNSSGFSGGIITNKDAGEKSLTDFISGYADITYGNFHATFGDFVVSSGAGGIYWRRFGYRKGSETIFPTTQFGTGISPNRSSLDYGFFRGSAAEYSIIASDSITLTVSAFGSFIRRNATIDSNNQISSLKTDGYFRTESEFSKRQTLPETAFGGIAELRAPTLTATISVLNLEYGFPIVSASSSAFSGSSGTLIAFSGQWSLGQMLLAGELCRDARGNLGGSMAAVLTRNSVTATVGSRFYAAEFRSPFGYSFGEFSVPGNEFGIYTGFNWRKETMQFAGYADIYGSFEPRFGMTRPTRGIDIFLENRSNLNIATSLLLRVQFNKKNDALSTPETVTDYESERISFRAECTANVSPSLKMKVRAEAVQVSSGGIKQEETGIVGFVEFHWQPIEILKFSGRIAAFSTESFASARWAFEYTIPGIMSNPALFGNGSRYFVTAQITPATWFTLRLLYSVTAKNGVPTIGSGYEEIAGATDSRLTLQLDATW